MVELLTFEYDLLLRLCITDKFNNLCVKIKNSIDFMQRQEKLTSYIIGSINGP